MVLQRWAIADGDGEADRPFKSEWATVKVRTRTRGREALQSATIYSGVCVYVYIYISSQCNKLRR